VTVTSQINKEQVLSVTRNSSRKKYFALTNSGSSPASGCSANAQNHQRFTAAPACKQTEP